MTADEARALLERTDAYLTVQHEHARRHDHLAESGGCEGCALRAAVRDALTAAP